MGVHVCRFYRLIAAVWVFIVLGGCSHRPPQIPAAPREFRAAWVATVNNIDWPSRADLSSAEQQEEIREILDRAAELKLNAIILQVRTSCDAMYPSNLEPWSEYLTGSQGKPPEPFYDPLQMWIEEAHKRGIELHAWFNPFRARQKGARSEESPDHISKAHPQLVKAYGDWLWLDPGEEAAQEHTIHVFADVVKRYDIDGVHIDDYFYPYPVRGSDFPDEPSWSRYVAGGGTLARADWRRQNINRLVERIYSEVKREKPWVRFGISPFGIWKPGHPATVRGFNQYESLYADARLWLNEGWCDYFTPQLYWKISAAGQPYPDLLDWWNGENLKGRHVWPGNYTSRVADGKANSNWEPREIVDQIALTRARSGASGNVHFSMKALWQNRGGIVDVLRDGPYAQAALVPAAPWLDNQPPDAPDVRIDKPVAGQGLGVSWTPRGPEPAWLWAIYTRHGQTWRFRVVPGQQLRCVLEDDLLGRPDVVAVAAVDRCGNMSRWAIRQRP